MSSNTGTDPTIDDGDPSDDNNSIYGGWVYIPLTIFVIIGLAITLHQFRRRRRKKMNNALMHQALARDIEAMGGVHNLTSPTQPRRVFIIRADGVDSRSRTAMGGLGVRPSRWQWSIPLTTAGTRRNREDGLNELGEAPPPYESNAKDTGVPLQDMRTQGQAAAEQERPQPESHPSGSMSSVAPTTSVAAEPASGAPALSGGTAPVLAALPPAYAR